jgi:hypothetical protein
LFRHYWILFKLLLTTFATVVLLLKLGPISHLAGMAAETKFPSADLIGLRGSLAVHAVGGLLVLLTAVTLAVYKPQGMTPYGVRKQGEQGTGRPGSTPALATSAPGWVKVFGVIVVILILMVGVMLIGGGHGPGAHFH